MNLEDYLKSIGRIEQPTTPQEPVQIMDEQPGQVKQSTPLTTIGDIFDYFYKKGVNKHLPAGIIINR
jgi:hypothetical protein